MRKAILSLSSARARGQHPGLLLQRFLAHTADGSEAWSREKRDLLRAAITAAGEVLQQPFYRAAFERWRRSFGALTQAADLTTAGRLIVGLGSENVLETGIRLQHTYVLPILPGSALKGLAAHYCHEVWGQLSAGDGASEQSFPFRRATGAYHRLLFGTTEDSGCLTFHDAWLTPDAGSPLFLDVMTPHHPKWVDGSEPPTDFDSPVPVPFVSVAGTFHVVLSWTGPQSERATSWTELAFRLLREALAEWGIGGKTSSGYGRLTPPGAHTDPQPIKKTEKAPLQTAAVQRASGTPARVKIVSARPRGGFVVLEAGRPQGTLTLGTPPPGALTEPGSEVEVQVHVDHPRNPQYKWPPPPKTR